MFRLTRIAIDTHSEHVIFLHERASRDGEFAIILLGLASSPFDFSAQGGCPYAP